MRLTHTKLYAVFLAIIVSSAAAVWVGLVWLEQAVGKGWTTAIAMAVGALAFIAQGVAKDLNARDGEKVRPLREQLFGEQKGPGDS